MTQTEGRSKDDGKGGMKERKPGARGGSRAGLRQGKVRRDDPSHRVAVSLYGNMICYGCNWSDKTSGGKIQTTSTVRLVQDRGPIPPSWRGATGATSTKPALCDSANTTQLPILRKLSSSSGGFNHPEGRKETI